MEGTGEKMGEGWKVISGEGSGGVSRGRGGNWIRVDVGRVSSTTEGKHVKMLV